MTQQEMVVVGLKNEAAANPVARAVFEFWAARERSRRMVTIHALKQKMGKLGLTFTRDQYAEFLKKLAALNLGRIEQNSKGGVVALRDVRITLKSIGQAAIGGADTSISLKMTKVRNRFANLEAVKAAPKDMKEAAMAAWNAPERKLSVKVAVAVKGKVFNIDIPKNASSADIADLIAHLQGLKENSL